MPAILISHDITLLIIRHAFAISAPPSCRFHIFAGCHDMFDAVIYAIAAIFILLLLRDAACHYLRCRVFHMLYDDAFTLMFISFAVI